MLTPFFFFFGLHQSIYLPLEIARAVTVTVGNEVEANKTSIVGLGGVHKVKTRDLNNLAVLDVLGIILESEKDTTAAPAELVAQRIIRVLWCGQTTTKTLKG